MRDRDQAARLRSELVDVGKLCAALGLSKGTRRQAKGLTVLCPWHPERGPSCSVTLGQDGTVRVRCFGCGASGDALTLIAQVRGLDIKTQFPAVLQHAAELVGTEPPHREVREPERRPRLDAASYAALAARLVEVCPITGETDVVAYISHRGLLVQAALAQFAALPPPSKQGAIIAAMLRTFELETLELAGLVDRRRPRDRFAFPHHRLVITWRGLDGAITILQRRSIDEQHPPKYILPPGMRPVQPFGAEQLRTHADERTILFVEGALDVLAWRVIDRRERLGVLPLGLPGLDGWRPEWARYARGRTAGIGFDADRAAERKVDAVNQDLWEAGAAKVQRWRPSAKDWAELLEGRRARKGAP